MKNIILLLVVTFFLTGCRHKPEIPYLQSVKKFHAKRIQRLKQPNSWLSLVGLYWLKEGDNSFGAEKSNNLIFPTGSAPDYIGNFILKDSIVTVKINKGIEVTHNDSIVATLILQSDMTGNPTVLKHGSLSWFVIQRGGQYGIRLKDSKSKLLKEFDDIEMFTIDSIWKIEAEFVNYDEPKEVEIPTAIGTVEKGIAHGKLKFTIDNEEFSLEPLGDIKNLFLVFGDKTNGEETYGAGRFLSLDEPDSTGKIFIDFNKAYNPPCVFTKYATCPLPTKDNYLKTEITAGEKNFHSANF